MFVSDRKSFDLLLPARRNGSNDLTNKLKVLMMIKHNYKDYLVKKSFLVTIDFCHVAALYGKLDILGVNGKYE